MTIDAYITKGTRIRARWFGAGKLVALSGVQMKGQVTEFLVRGVVRHIRGDHPTEPTTTRLYVDPDHIWSGSVEHCEKCGVDHVVVDPAHVVEVLP